MQGYYTPAQFPRTLQPQGPPPLAPGFAYAPQYAAAPTQIPVISAYQRHRYETYVPPPPEPAGKTKPRFGRSQSMAVPVAKAKPLKSAMKKRNHERSQSETFVEPISRQTSRHSEPREQMNPILRTSSREQGATFMPGMSNTMSNSHVD